MKKMLLLSLATLVAALSLGCANQTVTQPKEVDGITQAPTNAPQSSEVVKPTEEAATAIPTSKPTEIPTQEAFIEEAVLVERDGVRITAKSLDTKSIFGTELKLLIENDSDKNLIVQAEDVSVNGYMVSTLMSVDVAAGKKANDELTFMDSSFEDCGITTIADIELVFHVIEANSYDSYFDSDPIIIKTSAAEGFDYTYDESGTLAYEGNGIKIIVKGLKDSMLGPEILVYVHNTSSEKITVQTRDVSINSYMVSDLFSCGVCPGKHAVDTITFLSSELEENSIEKIDEVELSFHLFDSDSWKTIEDTDTITIKF